MLKNILILSLIILFFESCSSTSPTQNKLASQVNKMIKNIQPDLQAKKRKDISEYISEVALQYKIDPQIIIAIIATESNFDHSKISVSGDLSIAQINVKVWNEEFKRLGKKTIQINKLISDEKYAIQIMAEILTILRKRHSSTDKEWYARYHSGNDKYKIVYLEKLKNYIQKMS